MHWKAHPKSYKVGIISLLELIFFDNGNERIALLVALAFFASYLYGGGGLIS